MMVLLSFCHVVRLRTWGCAVSGVPHSDWVNSHTCSPRGRCFTVRRLCGRVARCVLSRWEG